MVIPAISGTSLYLQFHQVSLQICLVEFANPSRQVHPKAVEKPAFWDTENKNKTSMIDKNKKIKHGVKIIKNKLSNKGTKSRKKLSTAFIKKQKIR